MKLAEKKDIGERIRSMRKEAGLTQDELAERCGMKQHTIFSIRREETRH